MTALDSHVHRWEPATTGGSPTLLLLHGTGGDENDLVPLGRTLYPGSALLSVRGNVIEHGAPRFFRRLAEGVFDVPDLHRRTAELAEFLTEASVTYGFSAKGLYAIGFSNGANIAASLLLSRWDTLAGGVLLRVMVPFAPDHSPDLSEHSVLLSQGRVDPIVSVATGERLAGMLRDAGATVELAWQPASHQLTNGDVDIAREWLSRVVPVPK